MEGWRIIGFFGSSAMDEIPKVLTSAVLDPAGARVAILDVGSDEADLLAAESMSLEEFQECTGFGSATPLPPVLWEPSAVLFLMDGALELVSCWEAEFRMKKFVQDAREEGELAFQARDLKKARERLDDARRVSFDDRDTLRVMALEPDASVRETLRMGLHGRPR